MKNILFGTLLILFALVFGFGAVEGGLRLLKKPNMKAGWKDGVKSEMEANELAYRGQKINYEAGDTVTVLLGGSNVSALGCSFWWTPENRLEKYLNRKSGQKHKVFSIGSSGWGTDQQFYALSEYFSKYRADRVMLWFSPGDDFWNNVFPTGDPDGKTVKPTFWLEGEELKGPNYSWEEPVVPLGLRLAVVWARLGGRLPNLDQAWEKKLPSPYVPANDFSGTALNDWEEKVSKIPEAAAWENLQTEKSHWAAWLTPRSPRSEYAVKLTRKLMEKVRDLSKQNGAEFSAFWAVGKDELEEKGERVHKYRNQYYTTSLEALTSKVEDSLQTVAHHRFEVMTENPYVNPTDRHFNQHAIDELMQKIAKALGQKPAVRLSKLDLPKK